MTGIFHLALTKYFSFSSSTLTLVVNLQTSDSKSYIPSADIETTACAGTRGNSKITFCVRGGESEFWRFHAQESLAGTDP